LDTARKTEIGLFVAGLTVANEDGDTITFAGVPSPGLAFVGPGVYLSRYVTDKFAIEPQLGLLFADFGGDSLHALTPTGRLSYVPKGKGKNSPYLFGAGTLVNAGGDGDSQTEGAVGGGIGFRLRIRDAGALRIEGRYERYLDPGRNVFGFTVGLGLMF